MSYQGGAAGTKTVPYTSINATHIYFLEIRTLGTSVKIRFCDTTAVPVQWLQPGPGGGFSNALANAATDTMTNTSSGYIQIGQLGGVVSTAIDDFFWDAPIPSIDNTTILFPSTTSPTKTLTAGGFTDPLAGVTWASSNAGIATVSAGGVVTPVAKGTTTITATGVRDTTQTATGNVIVGLNITPDLDAGSSLGGGSILGPGSGLLGFGS